MCDLPNSLHVFKIVKYYNIWKENIFPDFLITYMDCLHWRKDFKFGIAQGINQVISRLFHGVLADNKELCLWGFDHKLGKGCLLLGCLDSICFSALHKLSMSFPSNAPPLVVKTWQISKNSAVISSSFFLPLWQLWYKDPLALGALLASVSVWVRSLGAVFSPISLEEIGKHKSSSVGCLNAFPLPCFSPDTETWMSRPHGSKTNLQLPKCQGFLQSSWRAH